MCNDELEGVFQEKNEIRKNGSKTGYSFTAVRLTTGFDNQVIILRVYQSSGDITGIFLLFHCSG